MSTIMGEMLWIFDFDGTLSPLVPERDKARIHPVSLNMLAELSALPLHRVAILSSRMLDDLIPRIPLPGIFLGGGSGMEWQIPDGPRAICGDRQRLRKARSNLMPVLKEIASIPGIELEDKKWSVALHTRRAHPGEKRELASRLEKRLERSKVNLLQGPEVIEVQLIPDVDKAFGVKALCELMKFTPSEGEIVYAGDDTNDACAMRLVDNLGGITVTVGNIPLIPGSVAVSDQIALADEIRKIAGLIPIADNRQT